MKITDKIKCLDFPCLDVDKNSHSLPTPDIDTAKIKIVMITEAPPNKKGDYFYNDGNPYYLQTVIQAFKDAGADVSSIQDILNLGVYITTAIKCGKTGYTVSPATIKNCSRLLEQEIALFSDIKAFLLGGDVAIKMMNTIWKQKTGQRIIPAGATYKIRSQAFYFGDIRVMPSYSPAGQNFLIEKSKRQMVAEDIRMALELAR